MARGMKKAGKKMPHAIKKKMEAKKAAAKKKNGGRKMGK